MDKTAESNQAVKLFDREPVVGETWFRTNHRHPVWRPAGVDRWIVNLTVDGRARINRGSGEFTVERGDLLLFPPGVIHDYAAAEGGDWVHLWCYFEPRPEWLRLLRWPTAGLGVGRVRCDDPGTLVRIEAIFRKLHALYEARQRDGRDFCLNALEELLLWTHTLAPREAPEQDERLRQCVAWMAKHLDRPLRVEDLARRCHLSPSRFAHWFRAGQGCAPMRCLEALRMEKARELLSCTGMDVGEIAVAVGYADPLHFSRVFRRNAGVSPRRYRLRGGN